MTPTPWSGGQDLAGQRILVIGGSIGGLTAGLLLRDLGADVQIFERSSHELEGRGAGIVVHEATVRYLIETQGFDLDMLAARAGRLRYLRRDGSVEHDEARPYHLTAWSTLYRALRAGFGDQGYHLGAEVVRVGNADLEASVELYDGRLERAAIVVCADGISSTARAALMPDVAPVYAGYVGWRGVVAESELSRATQSALDNAITYQVLPGSHILVYPIPGLDGSVERGARLMNFVWYRNVSEGAELDRLLTGTDGVARSLSVPPGLVAPDQLDDLRSTARRDLAPPIAEVVGTAHDPFVQVIVDVEVPHMALGRILLLGDAAFSARPHAAAGTAKACADAWALAEEIQAAGGQIDAAGRAWERRQLEVGHRLVERARWIGERSQLTSTFWPGDPSLRFGLFGPGQ